MLRRRAAQRKQAAEARKKAKATAKLVRKVGKKPKPLKLKKVKVTAKDVERIARKIKAKRPKPVKVKKQESYLDNVNTALDRTLTKSIQSLDKLVKIATANLVRTIQKADVEVEKITFADNRCTVTYRKTEVFDL